jgi:hypothetical protein
MRILPVDPECSFVCGSRTPVLTTSLSVQILPDIDVFGAPVVTFAKRSLNASIPVYLYMATCYR